jgi:hypothetical protein
MTATSRSHSDGQFGATPTIEQKIEIFSERVLGWQIDVAEEMSRQFFEALSANDVGKPMRHCGFAVVSVIFSYFETVAQYLQGASSNRMSADFFAYGFRSVYPVSGFDDAQIRIIYAYIRCGLYHSGLTRPGVTIYEGYQPTFSFDMGGRLLLNPFTLVRDVKRHLLGYVGRLRDGSEAELRQRFEVVFNWGTSSLEISQLMGSGSGW